MASAEDTLKDPGPPSTHDATKWILGALGAVHEETTPTTELTTEEVEDDTPAAINDKVRKIDTRLTTVEIKISKTKKPTEDDSDEDNTSSVEHENSAAEKFVQPDNSEDNASSYLNILSVM